MTILRANRSILPLFDTAGRGGGPGGRPEGHKPPTPDHRLFTKIALARHKVYLDSGGIHLPTLQETLDDLKSTEKVSQNTELSRLNLQELFAGGLFLLAANLSGFNLSHASLLAANMGLANLNGAKLIKANLTDVNLQEAKLDGAVLPIAILEQTDFRSARLNGTKLPIEFFVSAIPGELEQIKKASFYVSDGNSLDSLREISDFEIIRDKNGLVYIVPTRASQKKFTAIKSMTDIFKQTLAHEPVPLMRLYGALTREGLIPHVPKNVLQQRSRGGPKQV